VCDIRKTACSVACTLTCQVKRRICALPAVVNKVCVALLTLRHERQALQPDPHQAILLLRREVRSSVFNASRHLVL